MVLFRESSELTIAGVVTIKEGAASKRNRHGAKESLIWY